MRLEWPDSIEQKLGRWYVYGIRAEGGPIVYAGLSTRPDQRAVEHATPTRNRKKPLRDWFMEQVSPVVMVILGSADNEVDGRALEQEFIGKLDPLFNDKHTTRLTSPNRDEIDVDCHWDKKYWIDNGE